MLPEWSARQVPQEPELPDAAPVAQASQPLVEQQEVQRALPPVPESPPQQAEPQESGPLAVQPQRAQRVQPVSESVLPLAAE